MQLARPLAFAARGQQILFGAVVLGLSVKALKWQYYGHVPSATSYAIFAGSLALLVGLIGITCTFISRFEKPLFFADVLTAALCLAGGMALAIQLRDVNRKDYVNRGTIFNGLVNGGIERYGSDEEDYYDGIDRTSDNPTEEILKRCQMMEADAMFLFLTFVAATGAVMLGLLALRKARRSYGAGSGV